MNVAAVILDLDGTVYRAGTAIPGVVETIGMLRERGVEIVFFSNNPTKSPTEYVSALAEFGIAAEPSQILTSGVVTARYLEEHHPSDPIFLIGEPGLEAQLADRKLVGDPAEAEVLVTSIDREFTYQTLTDGLHALESGVEAFIGTDPDRSIPAAERRSIPGSGAITGAVAATGEREPDLVLGKPSGEAIEAVRDRIDAAPEDCLVVGDRLNTDVALGNRGGMQTALVLTGAHDRAAIEQSSTRPDHVLDSLADLPELL